MAAATGAPGTIRGAARALIIRDGAVLLQVCTIRVSLSAWDCTAAHFGA